MKAVMRLVLDLSERDAANLEVVTLNREQSEAILALFRSRRTEAAG